MSVRVVFVEDSREVQGVIEDLLGTLGQFEVVARHTTESEATEWLQDPVDWNLAIVDLVLREGSGFNLLSRLRESNAKGRILVLSDYASTGVKVRCVEMGADAVFSKGEVKAFAAYVGRLDRPDASTLGLGTGRAH